MTLLVIDAGRNSRKSCSPSRAENWEIENVQGTWKNGLQSFVMAVTDKVKSPLFNRLPKLPANGTSC